MVAQSSIAQNRAWRSGRRGVHMSDSPFLELTLIHIKQKTTPSEAAVVRSGLIQGPGSVRTRSSSFRSLPCRREGGVTTRTTCAYQVVTSYVALHCGKPGQKD